MSNHGNAVLRIYERYSDGGGLGWLFDVRLLPGLGVIYQPKENNGNNVFIPGACVVNTIRKGIGNENTVVKAEHRANIGCLVDSYIGFTAEELDKIFDAETDGEKNA